MELKFESPRKPIRSNPNSNRTFMELKLKLRLRTPYTVQNSNRTFMELK